MATPSSECISDKNMKTFYFWLEKAIRAENTEESAFRRIKKGKEITIPKNIKI